MHSSSWSWCCCCGLVMMRRWWLGKRLRCWRVWWVEGQEWSWLWKSRGEIMWRLWKCNEWKRKKDGEKTRKEERLKWRSEKEVSSHHTLPLLVLLVPFLAFSIFGYFNRWLNVMMMEEVSIEDEERITWYAVAFRVEYLNIINGVNFYLKYDQFKSI